MQIGEVCQVDGVSDDQMTCSDDSVLASWHLFLVAYLLKVGLKFIVQYIQHNTTSRMK